MTTDVKMRQPRHEAKVPKIFITMLNQIYEIERKVGDLEKFGKIKRNIERMKEACRSEIYPKTEIYYEDPMGQKFDDTRSDLEAHIVGESTENLIVIDVIKPIIRVREKQQHSISQVVQRGIVTVETRKTEKGEDDA